MGAASAGLPRAQALLAKAIAPHNAEIDKLVATPNPDPDEIRRTLLESVGGRKGWTPKAPT